MGVQLTRRKNYTTYWHYLLVKIEADDSAVYEQDQDK